jgi:hypothetical protein
VNAEAARREGARGAPSATHLERGAAPRFDAEQPQEFGRQLDRVAGKALVAVVQLKALLGEAGRDRRGGGTRAIDFRERHCGCG